jgi:hypothetical protein
MVPDIDEEDKKRITESQRGYIDSLIKKKKGASEIVSLRVLSNLSEEDASELINELEMLPNYEKREREREREREKTSEDDKWIIFKNFHKTKIPKDTISIRKHQIYIPKQVFDDYINSRFIELYYKKNTIGIKPVTPNDYANQPFFHTFVTCGGSNSGYAISCRRFIETTGIINKIGERRLYRKCRWDPREKMLIIEI